MTNIYQALYDLIDTYIYGGSVVADTYQDLVCIILATCGCLFMVALPFVIIWRIVRVFL